MQGGRLYSRDYGQEIGLALGRSPASGGGGSLGTYRIELEDGSGFILLEVADTIIKEDAP